MKKLHQQFSVSFDYPVYFTRGIFEAGNSLFEKVVKQKSSHTPAKVLIVLDDGVVTHHPDLLNEIESYIHQHQALMTRCGAPIVLPGGEQAKNDPALVDRILRAVNEFGIDRHSFVVAAGGGAILDLAGYAAAIAHRGIRHIRIPTTVLSQNDSGIGVKNGINYFGKKNFLGTFAPPVAVINDFDFLNTLNDRDWRAGISEAIKVSLIKDAAFFEFLENAAPKLAARNPKPMARLIYDCARLHMEHIASGDPFEMGSSRPLDFGHWAAHKLEQLTDYRLRHGEAVAIGIALDATYARLSGMIDQQSWMRIIRLIQSTGFDLFVPELKAEMEGNPLLLEGLREFKEHLGGRLTIMLLEQIGKGREVHEMDEQLILKSVSKLEQLHQTATAS